MQNIIELGSGTGKHANLLAESGYNVLCLERSAEMVEITNCINILLPERAE